MYYVDFKLNNKRHRMFSGNKIGSSLRPNSYPAKLRRSKCELLAKEVYDYLVRNDYIFFLNELTLWSCLIVLCLQNLVSHYLKSIVKHYMT